jgi:hypothetical protein
VPAIAWLRKVELNDEDFPPLSGQNDGKLRLFGDWSVLPS